MYPKLAENALERWWLEINNLNEAVRYILDKNQESVPLSEELIKKVNINSLYL